MSQQQTLEDRVTRLERLLADHLNEHKARPSVGQAVTATTPRAHDPADPTVKIMPKSWKGEEQRGKPYSQCPPAFLCQLAKMLDAFADKNEQDTDPQRQRYAKWDRENAQRAREWAAKLDGKVGLFDGPSLNQLADDGVL
jgi:hypothetical protein